jgi:hypothetical protein
MQITVRRQLLRPMLTAALLALAGCGGGSDAKPAAENGSSAAPAQDAPKSAANPPATAPSARLQMLAFDAGAIPSGIQVEGKVVAGSRWRDAAGENLLLLTQTSEIDRSSGECTDCSDAELYAYQFVRKDGGWERLWRVADYERSCEFDLYVGFVKGSLTITDLDEDGTAESTFLYSLACRSDVSPATRKLIMHEGAAKYAIRGTTDLTARLGPEYGGGERTIDPAFDRADPAHRAYALRQWDRYAAQDFEEL